MKTPHTKALEEKEKPYTEYKGKKYVRGMGMMPWPVGSRKRTKSEEVKPVFTKAFLKK
jgi:hypothetical protein